ncbi:MAG: 6-bladed beta-propeller [Cyclobacteriaceae bacterium]|nr:6-bladed beta-propeller [Cyclobacteriaceae bacterium]MDH4295650.1 6-bladed beta-propeller [Cyclobacteriaceae bacterium]MDH5247897.1 6-bladed beta-propeller [Cyclobacteriaceae bacterium]
MATRRTFIRKAALVSGVASALPSFGFNILTNRPADDGIIGHGEYRYKVVKDWAKISPVHNPLMNCHEMVMDSSGRLLMLGDDTHNNVLVFDKSGKLLDYWGTQYPGGHGLTLTKEGGEDFLFIVDCGWYQNKQGQWTKQAGQVFKTDITGRLLFNLGDPHTLGIYRKDQPFMPTEVAVGPNGDIYVADGYGSDYIIQYDYNGKYIRHFGGHENSNAEHNLVNAHGVAIDHRGKEPLLVCTSRTEYAFKYFTLDGKYIRTVKLPGLFVCRPVLDDQNIYAGVCWSETKDGQKWVKDTGFITILDGTNKVVSNPGGTEPVYVNNSLQQMYQTPDKIFNHGHDVCVDEDKNLYVCQWNANHTPPVKLVRV